jgi:hypothetical protein
MRSIPMSNQLGTLTWTTQRRSLAPESSEYSTVPAGRAAIHGLHCCVAASGTFAVA